MGRHRALNIPLATAALALVFIGAGPAAGTQAPGPPTQVSAQAPNFDLNWYSVNNGGKIATSSPSYELGLSAGQAAAGERTSASFELGIGFWYGSPIEEACDCGVWGDVSGDDAINPVDVVKMVNFVYKGNDTRVQPPNCPRQAGDVNCDGNVNPVDVVKYVNYVYKGQIDAFCADPCGP